MEEQNKHKAFHDQVGEKEELKLKAQRQKTDSVWQGFSVFGIIGWSVAVPTVILVLIGVMLDERYTGRQSYTLSLLGIGIFLGCMNAWYWVSRKMQEIKDEETENDEYDH